MNQTINQLLDKIGERTDIPKTKEKLKAAKALFGGWTKVENTEKFLDEINPKSVDRIIDYLNLFRDGNLEFKTKDIDKLIEWVGELRK